MADINPSANFFMVSPLVDVAIILYPNYRGMSCVNQPNRLWCINSQWFFLYFYWSFTWHMPMLCY